MWKIGSVEEIKNYFLLNLTTLRSHNCYDSFCFLSKMYKDTVSDRCSCIRWTFNVHDRFWAFQGSFYLKKLWKFVKTVMKTVRNDSGTVRSRSRYKKGRITVLVFRYYRRIISEKTSILFEMDTFQFLIIIAWSKLIILFAIR